MIKLRHYAWVPRGRHSILVIWMGPDVETEKQVDIDVHPDAVVQEDVVFLIGGARWQRPLHIRVEADAQLLAHATVLNGITIGRGAVVLPYSVVTQDVPPLAVVRGTPARIIGHFQ